MIFIFAYMFLLRRYGTCAAPVFVSLPVPSTYVAPTFTRDDVSLAHSGRTVWDILWSCLATTFAVTWVSVHPNVPFLEEKRWSLLKRRVFLMCLALLAPEVMIMWAFKQWRGALMIREAINKARPNSCRLEWSLTHAHWLQMGGFRLRCTQTEAFVGDGHFPEAWVCLQQRFSFKSKCTRNGQPWEGVIQYQIFKYLLMNGKIDFPEISEEEINDRSKGDALTKGVVLLQISWFIVQLIARARQHLSVTVLEVTTAALAGLNSIMYLFWWSKPLNVRSVIVIQTKELELEMQDLCCVCPRHAERWTFSEEEFRLRDWLRNYLRDSAKTLCPVWMCTICYRIARFAQSIILPPATHLRSLAMWLLKAIRALRHLLPHWTRKDVDPKFESQSLTDGPKYYSVTKSDFRRAVEWIWKSCTLVVTKLFYLPYLLMFFPMEQILYPFSYLFALQHYSDAKDKMHNQPALQLLFHEDDMGWIMAMIFYSEYSQTKPLLIFSALAGVAFGLIHYAVWHLDFPSPVEQILWLTASLAIVGVCFCIVVGVFADMMTYALYWNSMVKDRRHDSKFWKAGRRLVRSVVASKFIIFLLSSLYPLSRLSLLILAIISLRQLPPSALETVAWTKFIPHI